MEYRLLNGIRVYAPKSSELLIDHAFANSSLLVAVNAEKILHATDQSRNITNKNLGYPDGFGAVMALKKKGLPNAVKIPGCELWLDITRNHYKDKFFYLVGGKDSVIEKVVTQLKKEFPGIEIVNFRNGYFESEGERQRLIDDVVSKKPDIVFVAMGSPRQELLMEAMHHRHPAVYQGLGGSFDVYIGNVDRAPAWWINHNLEWLYRLLKEPRRIRRHVHLIRFLSRLFLGRI